MKIEQCEKLVTSEAVRVTKANIHKVAIWCGGEVGTNPHTKTSWVQVNSKGSLVTVPPGCYLIKYIIYRHTPEFACVLPVDYAEGWNVLNRREECAICEKALKANKFYYCAGCDRHTCARCYVKRKQRCRTCNKLDFTATPSKEKS